MRVTVTDDDGFVIDEYVTYGEITPPKLAELLQCLPLVGKQFCHTCSKMIFPILNEEGDFICPVCGNPED